MPRIAARAGQIPRSGIREVADLALQVPDAIRLEIGDPDFVTPEHVIAAAAQAARDGFTKYAPSAGLPSLRELIVEKVRVRNGIDAAYEQTLVTTGGCGGIFATLLVLLDPGDQVLFPDPAWTHYAGMAGIAGAEAIGYPLDPAAGFEPDLERLEALIGPRTRVLLVNSPGNPTGAVFRRETAAALVELAARHDLWLISDECYDEMVFEGEHVSLATLPGAAERVISIFTFSKSYAMTGWRVGYLVAPPGLSQTIVHAHEPAVASVSTISQKGAEAALAGPQDVVAQMRDAYRDRRDLVLGLLDRAGVGYVRPRGAFYLMIDVSSSGEPSREFARRLLLEHAVATVPGDAFGSAGEGFVRISLAAAETALRTGTERLVAALRREEASDLPERAGVTR